MLSKEAITIMPCPRGPCLLLTRQAGRAVITVLPAAGTSPRLRLLFPPPRVSVFGRNDPHLKIGKIKYRSIFLIALEQPSRMARELLTPGQLTGPEDRLASGAAGPSKQFHRGLFRPDLY